MAYSEKTLMKNYPLYTRVHGLSIADGALALRLLTLWLLLGQPAMARYRDTGDPGWSADLFKFAPPGALLAMGGLIILIGAFFYAAKRSSGKTANSFIAMALLSLLPLLGLVVWYQPVLLVLPVVIASFFAKGSR